MNYRIFLIVSACLIGLSCRREEINPDVDLAVERDLVTFDAPEVPESFKKVFSDHELVIFGETHYVQEHQEFLVSLLHELSGAGYNVIFEEQMHCFSWLVEDYLNGDITQLPETILFFDETLIEGIKAYNASVDNSRRFSLVYMDLNQWATSFSTSVNEMEKIIGQPYILSSLLNYTPDSDPYLEHLQNAQDALVADSTVYIASLGRKWYDRILDMIPVEIESSNYRTGRNDELRESAMTGNIMRYFVRHHGSKAVINTGMFHAQKESHMWLYHETMAHRLSRNFESLATVTFIGMKGETKNHFYDTDAYSFNLPESAKEDNLIKLLARLAGDSMSYLTLEDPVFMEQEVVISYDRNTTIEARIGRQFDALVTYPRVSTLQSMDRHHP